MEESKNGTITAISHIWHANTRIKRLHMHAMNASSTEAEIMAMHIGLEFALSMDDIKHITPSMLPKRSLTPPHTHTNC